MKTYSLTATLNSSATTVPIQARTDTMAKTLACIHVGKSYIGDKRWSTGAVVLKNPDGKSIMKIEEEGKE